MSLFIGVNAEFPRMNSEQMEEVFNRLKEKKWVKIKNTGRGFSSLWFARFKDDVDLEAALLLAEKEFNLCTEPFAKPRMVIHAGYSKPKIIDNP